MRSRDAHCETPQTDRPASIDAAKVSELKAQGLDATEIAKVLGIGRASRWRIWIM
jgi:hypothetical protein